MKIEVTLQKEIIVEFDENSEAFKQMFEDYKMAICDCDYEDFADNVAQMVARYGGNNLIEGVGYPRLNGENQIDYFAKIGPVEHDCPVNVITDFDINGRVEFENYYTQTL